MAWRRLSIPRIRFERIGTDMTLDWSNVRGVKFVYTSIAGSTGYVGLDDLVLTAGADGAALTGVFRARYKYVFSDDLFDDESPASPVSDPIGLNAEAIRVSIPRQSAMAMDTQTTHVWLYLWSSAMGAYYRTLNPISMNRTKFCVNEFGPFEPDGAFPRDDRRRLVTAGFVSGRRYTPGQDPVTTVSVSSGSSPVSYVTPATVSSVGYSYGAGYTLNPSFPGLKWVDAGSGAAFVVSSIDGSASTITSATFKAKLQVEWFTPDPGETLYLSLYPMVYINSTRYYGTTTVVDTTNQPSAFDFSYVWSTNPATGAAWTPSERNSAYFGVGFGNLTSIGTSFKILAAVNGYYDAYVEDSWATAGGAVSNTKSTNILSFKIQTSEAQLLLYNNKLRTGRVGVPDNIIAVVGDHYTRTLALTTDFLYVSDPGHPGRYPALQAIKVADGVNEQNLWMHKAGGALYIGTNKDIYRLDGNLTELADGTLSASLRPLNIGSPPVDSAIAFEGNALVYRASDGPRLLVGEVSSSLRSGLDLLLRGQSRSGVSPITSTSGRHRMALAAGYLYWAVPQPSGSRRVTANEWTAPDSQFTPQDRLRLITAGYGASQTTAVYRYSFATSKWSLRTYPFTIRSLTRDLDGNVLAGAVGGRVVKLNQTTQDLGSDIPVAYYSTQQDAGRPLARKVPYDLSMRVDTGGNNATVGVYLDGSDTPATTFTVATSGMQVYKRSLSDLDPFRRLQLRLVGSFDTFRLYDWNVSYRDMPQHHYYLDTGNVETNFEYYRWFREIQLLVRSADDLSVDVWFDDVLVATETVSVTPNVTATYTIPLGRTVRGRQPRVVVSTTSDPSTSEAGFELYWVKWKMRPSGNQSQKQFVEWSAANR